jgi:hypothetical protein
MHLKEKVIRVSGTIERVENANAKGGSDYTLVIERLDQFESIGKKKATDPETPGPGAPRPGPGGPGTPGGPMGPGTGGRPVGPRAEKDKYQKQANQMEARLSHDLEEARLRLRQLEDGQDDKKPAAEKPAASSGKGVDKDKPAEEKPAETTGWDGGKVTFEGNAGTRREGLVVFLLGSCTAGGQDDKAKGEFEQALKENHLRVRFAKPRAFAVTGKPSTVQADEIVVPMSGASPYRIYVRSGETYLWYAKYDYKTWSFVQDALKR